jgi:hypothetical protein
MQLSTHWPRAIVPLVVLKGAAERVNHQVFEIFAGKEAQSSNILRGVNATEASMYPSSQQVLDSKTEPSPRGWRRVPLQHRWWLSAFVVILGTSACATLQSPPQAEASVPEEGHYLLGGGVSPDLLRREPTSEI